MHPKCKVQVRVRRAHLSLSHWRREIRPSINARRSDYPLPPAAVVHPPLQRALRCRTQERRLTSLVLPPTPVRAHARAASVPSYVNLAVRPRLVPARLSLVPEPSGLSRRAPATARIHTRPTRPPQCSVARPGAIVLGSASISPSPPQTGKPKGGQHVTLARQRHIHRTLMQCSRAPGQRSPGAPTAPVGPHPLARTRFPRIGPSGDSREPGVAIYRTGSLLSTAGGADFCALRSLRFPLVFQGAP